ncbi:MAG: hypothetical protein H0T51_08760 [Pirellulales bacterium]|nr:hypothetical protein [Pirellulales bacterium]
MRSVVYFPELRTAVAVVPAHVAVGVDASHPNPSETTTIDFSLSGASLRPKSIPTPRAARRRPAVHTSVTEA